MPGRSSNDRVLKTINMFDNVKASIVSKLILEIEGSPVKRLLYQVFVKSLI